MAARFGLAALGLWSGHTLAAQNTEDLAWLDLEALGKIKVTSVSKRPEPAWNVAASLAVLTAEDIRHAGVRSLGDALRLAPGLSVAQINARDWMIGARGFDQQFANKLLVMIDGRSIYTPLFGGVLWDASDLLLADVAQIEIIRGPGAAVWGANAVNGVINIVSKPADQTLGTLTGATVGNLETSGFVRFGTAAGEHGALRLYAKHRDVTGTRDLAGGYGQDAATSHQTGFRFDRKLPADRHLTVQGDYYRLTGDYPATGFEFRPPTFFYRDFDTGIQLHGGNLLARWNNLDPEGGGLSLQAYGETSYRHLAPFDERRDTIDLELQHTLLRDRRIWIWGAGYRWSRDETEGRHNLAFHPSSFTDRRLNLFGQVQLPLNAATLDFVAGARVEHLTLTGWEYQPNLRLAWRPHPTTTVWAAVSRAVRSPTRVESALQFDAAVIPPDPALPGSPATVIRWNGQPGTSSELLTAYEVGCRLRPDPVVSFDLTAFLHDYDDLIDIAPSPRPVPAAFGTTPYLLSDWFYNNVLSGIAHGAELAVTWQPDPQLNWRLGYTWTHVDQTGPPGGVNKAYFDGSTPDHAAFLHLVYAPTPRLDFNLLGRLASARPGVAVPRYATVDFNMRWHPRPDLSLSLRGENLTAPDHVEFRHGLNNEVYRIRRALFLSFEWRLPSP